MWSFLEFAFFLFYFIDLFQFQINKIPSTGQVINLISLVARFYLKYRPKKGLQPYKLNV